MSKRKKPSSSSSNLCNVKRKRDGNFYDLLLPNNQSSNTAKHILSKSASTSLSVEEESILTKCGSCNLPLHEEPPDSSSISGSSATSIRHNIIVTCSNYRNDMKKKKSSSSSNRTCRSLSKIYSDETAISSPHFHLCCTGIPPQSSLYATLVKNKEPSKASSSDPASPASSYDIFWCPACDIKGTSMYLMEYFRNIQELKVKYYDDEESVDAIQPVGYVSEDTFHNLMSNNNNSSSINHHDSNNKNRKKNDGDGTAELQQQQQLPSVANMGSDNGFVTYLIQQQEQQRRHLDRQQNDESITNFKKTELRLDHIQDILENIQSSLLPLSSGIKIHDKKENNDVYNDMSFENNEDVIPIKHTGEVLRNYMKFDQTSLVGQPIRLLCNVSNCYYTGRIIDSRVIRINDLTRLKSETKQKYRNGTLGHNNNLTSRSNKTVAASATANSNGHSATMSTAPTLSNKLLLDKDIGKTQYLIRFRAGLEGRKIAVHEWVFLEEHPIMVAIGLVWAKVKNNIRDQKESSRTTTRFNHHRRNKMATMFRPAQLFVRTALEMIDLPEINSYELSSKNKNSLLVSIPIEQQQQQQSQYLHPSFARSSVNVVGIFFSRYFHSMVLKLNYCAPSMSTATSMKTKSLSPSDCLGETMKRNDLDENNVSSLPVSVSHIQKLQSCVDGIVSFCRGKTTPTKQLTNHPEHVSNIMKDGEEKKDSDEMKITSSANNSDTKGTKNDENVVQPNDKDKEKISSSSSMLPSSSSSLSMSSKVHPSILESYIKDISVAAFDSPPKQLQSYLEEIMAHNETLNIAITLASIEKEEQRRVKAQCVEKK